MAKHGVGGYAFLIGFILAVLFGIVVGAVPSWVGGASAWIVVLLIILGLIVGLLNVKDQHINEFLIAVIAVTMIGLIPITQIGVVNSQLSTLLAAILQYIVAFSAPAALVLGLKQIWVLGYTKAN